MSTQFMDYVLRICDRLFDKNSPECIDRQGQLSQATVLVVVFHLIMATAFVKMQEYELKHRKVARNQINISFSLEDLSPPPLHLRDVQLTQPQALSLVPGKTVKTGSESPDTNHSDKQSVPMPKSSLKDTPLQPDPMRTQSSSNDSKEVVSSSMNKSQLASTANSSANGKKSDSSENMLSKPGSGAPVESGSPTENGNATGGQGKALNGHGSGTEGTDQGPDSPAGNDPISRKDPAGTGLRAMGAIGPYKRALMAQLREAWKPDHRGLSLTVNLLIAKDGTLLDARIVSSSGDRRVDRQAISAFEQLSFRALPDWFQGEDLLFQFDLTSE